MQVQKPEVRKKIQLCAIRLFRDNGFSGTSMRDIAENAGITAGNIYRYYSSKESLFAEIVDPVRVLIENIIRDQSVNSSKNGLSRVANAFIEIYMQHTDGFIILTTRSEGTKHENLQEEIIDMVARRIRQENPEIQSLQADDGLLCLLYATSIVRSFFILVLKCDNPVKFRFYAEHLLMKFDISGEKG